VVEQRALLDVGAAGKGSVEGDPGLHLAVQVEEVDAAGQVAQLSGHGDDGAGITQGVVGEDIDVLCPAAEAEVHRDVMFRQDRSVDGVAHEIMEKSSNGFAGKVVADLGRRRFIKHHFVQMPQCTSAASESYVAFGAVFRILFGRLADKLLQYADLMGVSLVSFLHRHINSIFSFFQPRLEHRSIHNTLCLHSRSSFYIEEIPTHIRYIKSKHFLLTRSSFHLIHQRF